MRTTLVLLLIFLATLPRSLRAQLNKPLEFEVASLKPSAPGTYGNSGCHGTDSPGDNPIPPGRCAIELDPLTVVDDDNFLNEIEQQPNVPDPIKNGLRALH